MNAHRTRRPGRARTSGLLIPQRRARRSVGLAAAPAKRPVRAPPARLAQKIFSLRAPPWPPRPSLPAGAVLGQILCGAASLRKSGPPCGASLGNPGASCGPCVPPRRLKDGDATVARRGCPWCRGPHAEGDLFRAQGPCRSRRGSASSARRPSLIGSAYFRSRSQGKKIQVSCDTSVMKVSHIGAPWGLA